MYSNLNCHYCDYNYYYSIHVAVVVLIVVVVSSYECRKYVFLFETNLRKNAF